MSLTETKRPKQTVSVIEPNTERVKKKNKERQDLERQRAEKQKKAQQDQQRQKRWMESQRQANQMKLRREKQLQEEQQNKKKEEEQQSNTLSGKFGHMVNQLNTNSTNLQFTISGMDLRPAQIKVLISNVQNNSSLKALTMSRRKLTDVEGRQVSQKLMKNQFLQRLELEGNHMGPATLYSISNLLRTNQSIRLIDLQGNRLLQERGSQQLDYSGIDELAQALKINETVLSINLNGTGLDSHCSQKLREMMDENDTIILLDIQNNPDMDLNDVIAIQDKLIQNKQEHDDERYMEFIERKRLRREQDISGVLLLNSQTKKLRSEAIQLNIETKKAQLDQEWNDFITKKQLAKQKQILRMEKETGAKKRKKR